MGGCFEVGHYAVLAVAQAVKGVTSAGRLHVILYSRKSRPNLLPSFLS